jgi:hypothetical protein
MLRALIMTVLAVAGIGCEQSQRTQVALTGTPFTNQLQMHVGDSCQYQLPSGKTVAVWCVRPRSLFGHPEQTDSKSGLKTVWGEAPFRKPKEILVKVGTNNNHYAVAGWKSYIVPSPVTINGDTSREYVLLADGYSIVIGEDLSAANCLPVTIRVEHQ